MADLVVSVVALVVSLLCLRSTRAACLKVEASARAAEERLADRG